MAGGRYALNSYSRGTTCHIEVFTEAVRNLLEQGSGKFRNILIKGPANTGKTFKHYLQVFY